MSSKKQLPSIEYLRQVLDYNPNTGKLHWIADKGARAKAGREITRLNSDGYIYFGLDGNGYLGHRMAWYLYHGEDPNFEIDHIDGNKRNNIITNLRKADRTGNNRNKTIQKNNTSGFKGVHFKKENNKWCARIFIKKKAIHLGYFESPENAYSEYCKAAKKYFGVFARLK